MKDLPEIPDEMILTAKDRPDETGIALLQARHVLNEMENSQVEALRNGFKTKENVCEMNPIHPYAWGLFKTVLLKAMKNRADLKKWSPEVFRGDQVCHKCNGEGRLPVPQDSKAYKDRIEDSLRTQELIADGTYTRSPGFDDPFLDGDPLWFHCSPCQGSGVLTIYDREWVK